MVRFNKKVTCPQQTKDCTEVTVFTLKRRIHYAKDGNVEAQADIYANYEFDKAS